METHKLMFLVLLMIAMLSATSARVLEEQPEPLASSDPITTPVSTTQLNPTVATTATATTTGAKPDPGHDHDHDHTLIFFMHDILGGSNPSALAITGIVNNPAVSGQVAFAKPNGANLAINTGVPQGNGNNGLINNNNVPFLTGLSGITQNVVQNNGNNFNANGINFPAATGGQLPSGSVLQKLMFGTMTVIDDELTEGHELRSAFLGKAQGFYVASSVDGTSHTMAFTTMFAEGHYVDSLSFFGVHRTAVSESQLAIMGGTGKYVNAKGFAIVKTIPETRQQETDGIETLLEFVVYISY